MLKSWLVSEEEKVKRVVCLCVCVQFLIFIFFFWIDYINTRGGRVVLRALQAPEVTIEIEYRDTSMKKKNPKIKLVVNLS